MKHIVDDSSLILERKERAVSAILKAKGLDGRRRDSNGNIMTVNAIGRELIKLSCEFDLEQERIIFELEQLNADPDIIPGDFISQQRLIEQYCISENYEEVNGIRVLSEPDFGKYLTPDIIDDLSERWFTANQVTIKEGAEFYYNATFRWNVFGYQREIIQRGDLDKINFLIDAFDRPLIYQYISNEPPDNSDAINDIVEGWSCLKRNYDLQQEELSTLEDEANRGDFWIDLEKPMGLLYQEGDHIIYEIASRRFWIFVSCLYRLREWYPEYFGAGPSKMMEGLFNHFKDVLYGADREISFEKFKLRASQEFLYLSNEDKQLRLDLYRQIDLPKPDAEEVFTGGLFHLLDHFEGLRASLNNRGDFVYQEENVLAILRDMFFNHSQYQKSTPKEDQIFIAVNQYETPINMNKQGEIVTKIKKWKGVFFLSAPQNLFYLTSLHIR